MADRETTFRLKFENEDMAKVFEEMLSNSEDLQSSLKDIEKAQKEAFETSEKSTKKANEELQKQTKILDINKVKFGDFKNEAQNALEGVANKGGDATAAISRLGRAGGIVGTVIAGVGTAIAAAFLDVERNAKKARQEMEGLKAQGNELKNRVFAGIRGVVKQWAGDLAGASSEFNNLLGVGRKTFAETRKEAIALSKFQDSVKRGNQELAKLEASRAAELQRIQILAGDENKSTSSRISLLKEAALLETDLNLARIGQLNNAITVLEAQNDLYGKQPEILDEIAAIEAELIELRGANQVVTIQTQQEINALLREEADARARIIEQIKEANALIQGQETERTIERQIQAFKELRQAAASSGLGDQFTQELEDLDEVIAGLEKRLSDGLIEPFEKLPTLIQDAVQGSETDFIAEGAKIAESLGQGITEQLETLTPEQLDFLGDQFGDILTSVSDLVTSGTQIAVNQQQALIDARENAISELENQLAEQQQLEERGRANSADSLRGALQDERDVLEREQQKRLQLEKRAANQRLAVDSIQQASQITLATAKLLNQGASGFIPGLIAAAGGIALLFRILAQSKANAAAFSAVPQFREGTESLTGPSHDRGGILIEAEGGERILSRAMNEALGGSRMSNDDLVNFALMGMNADQAIAPLAGAISSGASNRQKVEEVRAWERNDALTTVFAAEFQKTREHTERILKERPTYYPTDQTGRREFYRGKTKVVEKIKPK